MSLRIDFAINHRYRKWKACLQSTNVQIYKKQGYVPGLRTTEKGNTNEKDGVCPMNIVYQEWLQ